MTTWNLILRFKLRLSNSRVARLECLEKAKGYQGDLSRAQRPFSDELKPDRPGLTYIPVQVFKCFLKLAMVLPQFTIRLHL